MARGTQLADVNVLFSLLWPRHEHHSAAQEWFASDGRRSWATNSITQVGVIRLLTNPAITRDNVNGSTALEILTEATQHPHHEFWPLDRPVNLMFTGLANQATGHRQWTDLLLFRHACERDGRLVTFDKAISALGGKHLRQHLLVLGG